MPAYSKFIERFRRVTYSGRYMPEVDGLRFVAIFLVAVVMHLGNLLREEQLGIPYNDKNIFHVTIMEGGYGVSLFFIISGFILALPFAEEKLFDGKKILLKDYYLRRVTRIEPPYIVSMILFLLMRVCILQYGTFDDLLPNFFASIFYVHNIVYHSASAINGVAWSLEVEIQFYLLAPFLTNIFFIKNIKRRRLILLLLIFIGAVFSYVWQDHYATILDKGCYFLGGIFLADCYLLGKRENNGWAVAFGALFLFVCWLFIPAYYVSVYFCVVKLFFTLLLFYAALTNDKLKKILSCKTITVIGGMCYSIYLVHMGLYGLLRRHFSGIKFFDVTLLNLLLQSIISVLLVLIVSSLFFLLVEKPTMKRNWYKNIFARKAAL